ncbi:MAG: 4-(cytidine 5'-diphospho)-2-C-methyl-D-erythritol kinase [Nocardioidaceae bacterium]|nr:4-(cytidine 5'-diphospho)-2-C-methyl-D-erythritol kinase [Nocardioidaceae bacterium]
MTRPGIVVRAPAKINLHLGVGGPREDGFHPLVTVYQAVSLYDDLAASDGDDWSVSVTTADYIHPAAVPATGDNIVDRAGAALAALHGRERTGAITIDKAIPIAGGMAGGSADAAAALVALDRIWRLDTSDDDLLRLAADLGSDVPFALIGGTALGTGRGELVEPVLDEGSWWWVVVPSPRGLSTPEVFGHFDRMFPAAGEPAPADDLLDAVATRDPAVLARALHNDLQPAALDLRPDLAAVIERGEAAGALKGMISGSGPTVLLLCAHRIQAQVVAGALAVAGHEVVLVANGPVAGAHVVEYA